MEKQQNYPSGTLGFHWKLITEPVTGTVQNYNNAVLPFAKKSLISYGFLTVLRKIEESTIYLKLYSFPRRIGRSSREIEDFAAAHFPAEIGGLDCNRGNIIRIHLEKQPDNALIKACKTIDALETLLLQTQPKEIWTGVDPTGQNGGLSLGIHAASDYFRWKKLLADRYLTSAYEEKCRKEIEAKKAAAESKAASEVTLQVFMKTGGEQPGTTDVKAINHFFCGNYAKVWAMSRGFIAEFISYDKGKIVFKMITDPRCLSNDMLLSKFIAEEFKQKVTVLSSANSFMARQYKAKDIIGFNLPTDDTEKLAAYKKRMDQAYAGLPAEPDMLHYGVLK